MATQIKASERKHMLILAPIALPPSESYHACDHWVVILMQHSKVNAENWVSTKYPMKIVYSV